MKNEEQKPSEAIDAYKELLLFTKTIDAIKNAELKGRVKAFFWIITLTLWSSFLIGFGPLLPGVLWLPMFFLLAIFQLNFNWQLKLYQVLKEKGLRHNHPIVGPLF